MITQLRYIVFYILYVDTKDTVSSHFPIRLFLGQAFNFSSRLAYWSEVFLQVIVKEIYHWP